MSYPYPPTGPGQQPPPPGSWGGPPPPPGYGQGVPPGGYGWPAGGPAPSGPPFGPPPGRSNTGAIVAVVIVAVIGLIALAGGAFYLVVGSGPDDSRRSAASASPTANLGGAQLKPTEYTSDESWSLWHPLDDRTRDASPLTLSEVLEDPQAKSVTVRDGVYTVQGSGQLDSDCAAAVWGDQLKQVLPAYGCTQVVRGTYVSQNQRVVGQVAVFNLKDVASANQLRQDLDPAAAKGFTLPLAGSAPIDKFGQGFTGANAGAYGHYVVVSWVSFTDGTPDATARSDSISPRSAILSGAKNFLFPRNVRAR